MRVTEPTGIFQMFEEISPEAIRAQRMAELNDLAKYRARRLRFYMDWADPVMRAKLQEETAAQEHFARTLYEQREPDKMTSLHLFADAVKITPIFKPVPKKRSWLARLFGRK